MIIKGRRKSEGINFKILAPQIEPMKESGSKYFIVEKSTLPERTKEAKPIVAPIEADTLFVAIAVTGGMPVNKSAGKEIRPPPPTTVSIKAAINPVTIRNKHI